MRKIDSVYENPFDNIMIKISESASGSFKKADMTPNDITTLSNIAAFITILLLVNAKYEWAAFVYVISYFFDCFDGFYARKYNMTSPFGDSYDHYSDLIKHVAIFYTLYYINPTKFNHVLPILVIAIFLCFVQVGCQEMIYDKKESDSLSFMRSLCLVKDTKDNDEIRNTLEKTRYFGCGTTVLLIVVIIIYYGY